MQKIAPFLWFDDCAEAAANFYVSVFKDARITRVVRNPASAPGPTGQVMIVAFELNGQTFNALNGGPLFRFNEAVSFVVNCEDQAEIDYYWEALIADGGQPSRCGWLKDKYGVSWQVVPKVWPQMMSEGDPARIERGMQAIMQMGKLDMAEIRSAYDG